MDKNTKLAVAIVIIILVIAIVYKITKYVRLNKTDTTPANDETLSRGSYGISVKSLQLKLNEMLKEALLSNATIYAQGPDGTKYKLTQQLNVDGSFGPITETYLLAFTGKKNIKVSDIDNLSLPSDILLP